MSLDNGIGIIAVPDKTAEENKCGSNESRERNGPANFEEAVSAAGFGKFQCFLFLAVIPVSWATSIDTGNVAIILPSAECDLQISFLQEGILNAAHYAGMVSSGFLWGYIADVRGRRSVFIYGYLADSIINIFAGFSQNFWTLVLFKLLSGLIVSGPHASVVAYCSEFYGIKERARIPLLIGFSVIFGNVVTAAMAWLIVPRNWSIVLWDGAFVYNSWRIFLSLCGVPTLLGVVCLSFFPESPKFLMSQGRIQEAMEVFKLIYRVNTGKSAEEYSIRELEDETCCKSSAENLQDGRYDQKAIFFYPHLPRLLLVTIMQFGTMLATNTIRLWQPQLFTILDNFDSLNYNASGNQEPSFCKILDISTVLNEGSTGMVENSTCSSSAIVNESVYRNTIIVAIFGNVCMIMASVLLNVLGHKFLLLIGYGVALFCILFMNWSTKLMLTLILTCFYVGTMTTALNTIVGAAVMMFPTSLRTIAVSSVMSLGRIGSILGNILFPLLLSYGCLTPIIILAIFILISMVLTCFLPLTKKTVK